MPSMPICLIYPFAPKCSLLPRMPICCDHFSWCPFPPKCPFAPNALLLQSSSVPKCPFAPKCPFVPNIHLPKLFICPNCPMPICSGAHFSWCPFPPQCPFAPNAHLPQFNVHRSQSAHLLHSAYLPWCSLILVSIYSKCLSFAPNAHLLRCSSVLKCSLAPNIHLSQSPHAHLFQTPICPKCSFTPIAQCPFALVLVFPGAHFPLKPTCLNVHPPQSAHLLQSAHLPQLLIHSGTHFSWCRFPPSAHFPPMLTCPNVHRSQGAHYRPTPKCPFAANTCLPLCCSFFLVSIFFKCKFAPNAHLSLCPSVSKVLVCLIKCPKYPFAPVTNCHYNCAHFSQVPICPK